MIKTCDVCNTEFDGHPNAKRCSDACKKQFRFEYERSPGRKEQHRVYNQKPQRQAQFAAFRETPKAKARAKERARQPGAKANAARYNAMPEVKARKAAHARRPESRANQASYKQSPKGKDVARMSGNKRRATKAGAESDGLSYTKLDKCVVCYSTENLTEEHLVALSNGGSDTLMNKTTMCQSCNSSKGARIDYRDPGYTAWIVERRLPCQLTLSILTTQKS